MLQFIAFYSFFWTESIKNFQFIGALKINVDCRPNMLYLDLIYRQRIVVPIKK